MHRDRTKTDLAFHKTNICALESADSISSCFRQSPIFKAGPGNVSKALSGLASSTTSTAGSAPEIFEGASPSFFPGSVALGEPGMFPPSSTGSTTFSHLRMDLVLVPPSRLWKREGPCNRSLLLRPLFGKSIAEGESSSWSSEARRTRTRSGREGTRRGTERSPRRRLGRTKNLKVGRGEPARVGCFAAIDSQGLGLKSQWKTRAHFGGHLSLLRRL